MRKRFVRYLRCPVADQTLFLKVFKMNGEQVVYGLLETKDTWYPIINGVPRLLIGELKTSLLRAHQPFFEKYRRLLGDKINREWSAAIGSIPNLDAFLKHQKKTAESFAYEWQYIYKENDYEKQNFFHFLNPFVAEADLKNKVTLDIGCGSGRFTKWAALSGTKVSFGSDLGETVEAAYKMTKNLVNVCIVQADIYAMPFRDAFDLTYSIGVLHHLPKPQEGFSRLIKVLKKGGRMLIWVYNRHGNARAIYFYEPLRATLKNLPKPLLYKFCYLPAAVVHGINYLTVVLEKGGKKALAKKMPFSYYANFPFNMKLNDAFDVLATPKSNYYYKEEVERWFKRSSLEGVQSYEHSVAGITCIGQYTGDATTLSERHDSL